MFCAIVVTHLSVCIALNQTLCICMYFFFWGSHLTQASFFMSNPVWVCLFFVCLSTSLPCPSHLGLNPRIFSHPNVLPMLGACQSPPAPHPIIITHWMPYGSLYNVLHEGTSEYFYSGHKVRTCHRFRWIEGICDLLQK